MRQSTILLSTAISLVLAGVGHADNNKAYIVQSGSDNTALIGQGGGIDNRAGTAADALTLTQRGNSNRLVIDQGGRSNRISTTGVRQASGLDQVDDRNDATIIQSSSYNYVNVVRQTGVAGAVETTNKLSITQTASHSGYNPLATGAAGARYGNVVTRVIQTNTGTGQSVADLNTVTIYQDRTTSGGPAAIGANAVGRTAPGRFIVAERRGAGAVGDGVIQSGTGNATTIQQYGESQAVRLVQQTGADNTAMIQQSGDIANMSGSVGNYVDSVIQSSTGAGHSATIHQIGDYNIVDEVFQENSGNIATLSFEGNRNGAADFIDDTFAYVAATGFDSDIIQSGTTNTLSLDVLGNDNSFGFSQSGMDNTIGHSAIGVMALGPVEIVGNGNAFGATQSGTGNTLDIGEWTGDRNDIGVVQSGGYNTTTIALLGDDNAYFIEQDSPVWAVAGTGNSVTLDITGDWNGRGRPGDVFTGVAAGMSVDLGGMAPETVSPGVIYQSGSSNVIELTVAGDTTLGGTGNLFGAIQSGEQNIIEGFQFGDGNQAAIAQVGNGNVVDFIQRGTGNILSVSQ